MTAQHADLMRERSGSQRVTNVELFFDLVYVFAVTQLSHFLLAGPHASGPARTAVEATVLLIMVWQLWAYTTWVTNWLDPDRLAVRTLLLALAVVSLVMSAAIPTASGIFSASWPGARSAACWRWPAAWDMAMHGCCSGAVR